MSIFHVIVNILTIAFGGYCAAHWALIRFYREKMWERRASGYTVILESLHEMKNWFETHEDELHRERTLTDDEKSKMTERYNEAKQKIFRNIGGEKWIMLPCDYDCVEKFLSDIKMRGVRDWFDVLETGQILTIDCINKIETSARKQMQKNLRIL